MNLSFKQSKEVAYYLLGAKIEKDKITTPCYKCWKEKKAVMRKGKEEFICSNQVYQSKFVSKGEFQLNRTKCGSATLKTMWLEKNKATHNGLSNTELNIMYDDLVMGILDKYEV